jgi:signal transduction histidine kinase
LIVDTISDSQPPAEVSSLASASAKHARIIIEQTQRMSTIIRQLLNLARHQPPHKETCDLCQLAKQTATVLATIAEKNRANIEICPNSGPHTALVDSAQIQQVFTNLIVNAIQAMQNGGKIRIGFGPSTATPPAGIGLAESGRIEVTVLDEGSGIPEDQLGQIFEPFFTTKPVGMATGLGLSVAYGIVQDHNGFITVESEPGRGSCFAIHIPVR